MREYSGTLSNFILDESEGFTGEAELNEENRLVGRVMTVKGPGLPSELGRTIVHEHIITDFALQNEASETWLSAGRKLPKTIEEISIYNARALTRIVDVLGGEMLRRID